LRFICSRKSLEGGPDHREFLDREIVGPEEGHFRVDVVVQALDDRDHGDDGQDADDDAEQGQEGAQLARPQGDYGHGEGFFDLQLSHDFRILLYPIYTNHRSFGL
jgi:hypothetical protein